MAKYPEVSDLYECELYPGRTCRVTDVTNARVTFQWLGDYSRIEPQIVPVNRFVVDFRLIDADEEQQRHPAQTGRGSPG
jgi:hypothetical protein